MARQGGYSRSTNDEWIKTSQQHYAEAIMSAASMGQDLTVWLSDAIAHHSYRCELILGQERYAADCRLAADNRSPSPMEADYLPSREPPSITLRPGQGRGPGSRGHRP